MVDEDALYADVGRRIRRERELRGWTQDVLASKVTLTRSSISNLEAGRQKALLHSVVEIAYALGVPPSRLFPDQVPLAGGAENAPGEIDADALLWIESTSPHVLSEEK